jgi:hypothetical protein
MTSALAIRSRAKVDDVRKWITALGVLTAGNMTRVEAEMKLRAYVPLLQDRFPPAAFTQSSLEAVASQCRFFPSYADVAAHLADWWRDHRPAPPALPPPPVEPPREPPTPEAIAYVHQRVREIVATLRAPPLYAEQQSGGLDDEDDLRARPRYLDPALLDQINPLPNGRKRTDANQATAAPAASLDPDHAASVGRQDDDAAA